MYRRLAAALFLSASPAMAADYEPPIYVEQAPEVVPVEVGSGWYLRGDVGYNIDQSFKNETFSFTPGPTETVSFSQDEYEFPLSLGIGYHWNDYFRTEINAGYLTRHEGRLGINDSDPVTGYTGRASTENTMWFGMANALVDLGTYAGFTPYVGAGAGLVMNRQNYSFSTDYVDPLTPDESSSFKDHQFNFAYTLNAGVSYAATRNLSIDLGYQYFSAPDAEYFRITSPTTFEAGNGVDFHQIKVGLRYDLW